MIAEFGERLGRLTGLSSDEVRVNLVDQMPEVPSHKRRLIISEAEVRI